MADRQKFPNSGALFSQRPQGKRPTWSGNLELDGTLLRELLDTYKSTGEAKLSLSGWDREGARGPWISVRCERFGAWKERKGSDSPSRDYNRNRDQVRDRGTTRSRYDEEDRRPPPREQRTERKKDDFFDDDIPF